MLDSTGTTVCPPQGGAASANCTADVNITTKLYDFYTASSGAVANPSINAVNLPANYASVYGSGTPEEVGVLMPGSGMKTLDPWGHYYIVCRWENTIASGSPAFKIISAGPNGAINATTCASNTGANGNQIVSMDAPNVANRASVWQVAPGGGTASFGMPGTGVGVDASGNLTVPGNLQVNGSVNGGNGTGTLSGNFAGGTVSGSTGTFSGAVIGSSTITATGSISANNNAFYTGANGTISAVNGAFSVDAYGNVAVGTPTPSFGITAATGNTNIAGTLAVIGTTTLGTSGSMVPSLVTYGAVNIGTTTPQTGTLAPLLTVGKPTAGSPPLNYPFYIDQQGNVVSTGSGSIIGGTLSGSFNGSVTASSIVDSGTLSAGATTINGATTITSGGAAITGNSSITGNLAVSGTITGTFVGVINLNGGSGSPTLNGVLPIANGGTNASDAPTALANLGGNDASNLTTGTLNYQRLDTTGITTSGGPYNSVTVDQYGRVTSASNVVTTSNNITDNNGDTVTVSNVSGNQIDFTVATQQVGIWTSTGLGIGTTVPHERLDVNGNVRIENAAGVSAPTTPNQLQLMNGSINERWAVTTDNATDTGASAGSNLVLQGYPNDNSNVALGTPALSLTRSGDATFGGSVQATDFIGSGAGLTSIGTAALGTQVIGVANGGTGTSTQFTPGDVVFAGANGIYTQDPGNFFWDNSNSNHRLGIGTATPESGIEIYNGEVQIGSSGASCSSTNAGAIRYNGGVVYYCDGVSTWQTVYSTNTGVGSGVDLGTASTATNPQRMGEAGTGLYTAASGDVDVASTGTQIAEFNANGLNIVTGKIGVGSTAPVVSLDLSKQTDAVALPVGTSGTRPAGTPGEIRYNSDNPGVEAFVNGNWVALLGGTNGALGVPNGGTGDTTLTLNGVLYGQGTNPIAATSAPLQYNVLVGNAGGVPVFGQVNLASSAAVTGILSTANGGTGSSITFTQGSVIFAGAGGALSQDNGNFYWNDGSVRLGLGTSSPTYDLSFGGGSAREIWVERGAATGNNLTVQAGGGLSGGSNENGGNLVLASGITTGTGTSNVQFSLYPAALSTNTTDNAALTALTVSATGLSGTTAVTTLQANAGAGSNQNGGALTIASGVSTGTGTSSINFNVYGATGSSSTPNSPTTAVTIASTGRVGIGTTSPAAKLDVYTSAGVGAIDLGGVNGISYPSTDSTAGGSIAIGNGALVEEPSLTSAAFSNTAIGYQAIGSTGLTTSGTQNTAVGYQTLKADTSGNSNVAIGATALQANTTGSNNVAVGVSLKSNTTGGSNTAVGGGVSNFNTIGSNNTAIGYNTLVSNVAGSGSTAVGKGAMYYVNNSSTAFTTYDTAVGALALNGTGPASSNTGIQNTAIGYSALTRASSGGSNTALGYNALSLDTSGANNTALGNQVASTTLATGSGNILIGVGTAGVAGGADTPLSTTSNFLNIGNTIEGNMANASAIGKETLYLNSVASSVNYIQLSGGPTGTGPTIAAAGTDTNVNLTLSPQGTGNTIISSGKVGIGTATPYSMLEAYNGEVQIGSSGALCSGTVAGALRYSGGSAYVCDGTNWDVIGGSTGGTLPALINGDIWVGNASNVATAVALSQDVTITNAGVATVGKIQNIAVGSPTGTAGTGVVLAGTPTIAAPNLTGTTTGVNLTLSGEEALTLGSDYTTSTTPQPDVNLGTSSAVRFNGSNAVTFEGIVAGTSGQVLYLHNASAYTLTLQDQIDSADGTAANEIITGTGQDLKVPANTSVTMQYDATAARWRVTGSSNAAKALAAGSDTQVQFNNSGNMAGEANFIWDYTHHRLGIGTSAAPLSTLDVSGGVAVGTSYAGVSVAPTNGMIVQGKVGIGTSNPAVALDVYTSAGIGAIDLGGTNGISYPSTDSTAGGSIAIGNGALLEEPSLASAAYGNTAIGYQAIGSTGLTTGAVLNTMIGYQAGNILTSGHWDTFIGASAGSAYATTAFNSVFIGANAGSNSNDTDSVFIGAKAGTLANGGNNIFIGYQSGSAVNSGYNNIVLGQESLSGRQIMPLISGNCSMAI